VVPEVYWMLIGRRTGARFNGVEFLSRDVAAGYEQQSPVRIENECVVKFRADGANFVQDREVIVWRKPRRGRAASRRSASMCTRVDGLVGRFDVDEDGADAPGGGELQHDPFEAGSATDADAVPGADAAGNDPPRARPTWFHNSR